MREKSKKLMAENIEWQKNNKSIVSTIIFASSEIVIGLSLSGRGAYSTRLRACRVPLQSGFAL